MTDITGRDHLIIAKALAYAIESIERLLPRQQEASDQEDMKRLLDHMIETDAELERVVSSARRHLRGEKL